MYPVLFNLDLGRLGHITIGTYGLFYALGFLLALRVAVVYARREGIETGRIVDLGIVTLLAGFVGAKLLLYLLDARYYLQHPMEMLRSLRSAGVFYGGFALALVAAVLYIRRHNLPLGRVCDLAAPALALGQGIGRFGCFMAGCCWGKVCSLPWAVRFTEKPGLVLPEEFVGQWLHPAQLYHAAADFLIFGITVWFMKRRRAAGQVFWVYILAYAVLRFTVEFFRGDSPRGMFFDGRLSTSQLIAVPAVLIALVMLYVLSRRGGARSRASRGGR